MAGNSISQQNHQVWAYSADDISYLADRLYSRAISNLSTDTPAARRDFLAASRLLVRLVQMYERASSRTLHTVMLSGEGK